MMNAEVTPNCLIVSEMSSPHFAPLSVASVFAQVLADDESFSEARLNCVMASVIAAAQSLSLSSTCGGQDATPWTMWLDADVMAATAPARSEAHPAGSFTKATLPFLSTPCPATPAARRAPATRNITPQDRANM